MSQQQPINMPSPNGNVKFKCGDCKWFSIGHKGKTCQQTRLVVSDTRACIEFQPFRSSQFTHIEQDKFLIEMRKTMLVWTETTIKKFDAEIRSYRMLSKMKTMEPMAYVAEEPMAKLGHLFEECQAAQERLLDIRFDINDKCQELQSFAKDVQAYIFSQYQDTVQVLKNESERGAFFRAAAPELFKAIDQMEGLKTKVELTHELLKNTHWALRGKLDAVLELWKAQVASLNMGKSRG